MKIRWLMIYSTNNFFSQISLFRTATIHLSQPRAIRTSPPIHSNRCLFITTTVKPSYSDRVFQGASVCVFVMVR